MTSSRVLLVDDEAPFVEILSKRLSRKNISILSAPDGEAALETLKHNHDIDIVILDIKMPIKGGIETLQEIRSLYPQVEVIILTGHATVESAIQGMRLGAFDYLMKPCDMDELLARIAGAKAKKDRR